MYSKFKQIRPFALVGICLLAVACAQQTKVVHLYKNEQRLSEQYARLLVVSISDDVGTRRRQEELIVKHLNAENVTGIASYQQTGLKSELLQNDVDAAARNSNADAILITHIVSVETDLNVQPGRTDIKSVCRGGEPIDYFLYDHRELKEPDTVNIAHTVIAVTNLYAAADGERIWTVQSTCFQKSSMDEALQDEAKAIVRQLKFDNLVGHVVGQIARPATA